MPRRSSQQDDNVVRLPHAAPGRVAPASLRQRELPLGSALASTIAALREIATLSLDNQVMEGPVHRDFALIGLCAEALHLARQARSVGIMRHREYDGRERWDAATQAACGDSREREQVMNREVATLLKRAARMRARSAAGIYAKALLVQVARNPAAGLGVSLAEDLIACDGLRDSLTWLDGRTEARP